MSKRYWREIDALYALGILLVIAGHSHSSDWSAFDQTPLVDLIQFIYLFHMALFFCIAGFLFQNSNTLFRLGYGRWLGEKALRLLIPYLAWSFFALVPKYYIEHHSFAGLSLNYVIQTIFCPRMNVWGHFWFLPVLFLLYLILGAVHILLSSKLPTKWLIVLEFVFSAIIFFLPIKTVFLGLTDLKHFLIFFVFGISANYLLAQSKQPAKNFTGFACGFFLIASAVAFLLRHSAYEYPVIGLGIALLMVASCWVLVMQMSLDNLFIHYLSNHNFTMYIFSWFFQSTVMMVSIKLHCGWMTTFLMMFVAGLLGPISVIFIYEHLAFLHRHPVKLLLGIR